MSLYDELQRARTEEDVKDAYIKALGLKGVFKGLVDIQTPEIWFEAKEAPTPPLLMFAQLLTYVRAARKRGEAIPGFLCVIDRETIVAATKFVLCHRDWFKRYEEPMIPIFKQQTWPMGANFEPHWCLVLAPDTRLAAIV